MGRYNPKGMVMFHEGENFEIVGRAITKKFEDSNGLSNKKVLGMYVHHLGANKIVQIGEEFLFLKNIEDLSYEEITD